jgi:TPR repeat protein
MRQMGPLTVLLCTLLAVPSAWGDVLLLKGGQRLEGDVVDKGKAVEIKVGENTLLIPKTEIQKHVPSIAVLTAEAEKIHTEAREFYQQAIKPDVDVKTGNEMLRKGLDLLRKATDLYQEAREVYPEEKQAILDAATVKLLQEMRLYRDKMGSEIAKGITPTPVPAEPRPEPVPEAKAATPAPRSPAPAKPARPELLDLLPLAKAGDIEAMVAAGLILEIEEWKATEAVKWFRTAADKGHLRAQVHLGLLALEGRGRKPDAKEAQSWLLKAEAKDEPLAKVYLAQMWVDGTAGSRSLHKADALCERAAVGLRKDVLAGDAESMTALGWMHLEGLGVPQSGEKALEFLRGAAAQGEVRALMILGLAFDQGRTVPQNRAEAVKAYRQAAERGYAPAQAAYGEIHTTNYYRTKNPGVDTKLAHQWFQKSAAQGNPTGQWLLGWQSAEGTETAKDPKEAFRLWNEALPVAGAKLRAQILEDFGFCNYSGLGIPKDFKTAGKYWKESADLGNVMAQSSMGWYADTQTHNLTEAIHWYELAARRNDPEALMAMGGFNRDGRGLPKSLPEAERWYAVAVQVGVKEAADKLRQVQQERAAGKR